MMPPRTILIVLAFSGVVALPEASFAQCTQTLSVGANVASAAANAANGSTICLNPGNYGVVNLFDIGRTGLVTLRSASGITAQMSPKVGNSDYIKFEAMTLTDVLVNNCSLYIEFWNSTFVPNAEGLVFNYDRPCGVTDMGLVVDGVTFDRVQQALFEGRLSVRGVDGLRIRNSVFSGEPTTLQSDGIFYGGSSRDIEIGPGNRFTGISQGLCGSVHCDAIQDYGGGPNNVIKGNLFDNGDTFIMMPDGSDRIVVENNVFDGSSSSYIDKIQFGSAVSPIFRHNTLKRVRTSFDSKVGNSATSNAVVQNNILVSGSSWKTSNGSGCTGCSFSYSLFDTTTNATGANNIIGTPTFVGGPIGLPAWQLAVGSVGKNAGNDGLDLGINLGSFSTLTAPRNLRIVG